MWFLLLLILSFPFWPHIVVFVSGVFAVITPSAFFSGVSWERDDVCKSQSDCDPVTAIAAGSKPTTHKGEVTRCGVRTLRTAASLSIMQYRWPYSCKVIFMSLKECSLSQFLGGSFGFLVLFLLCTPLKSFGLEGRTHSAATTASWQAASLWRAYLGWPVSDARNCPLVDSDPTSGRVSMGISLLFVTDCFWLCF